MLLLLSSYAPYVRRRPARRLDDEDFIAMLLLAYYESEML